jgi:hypothetical protein
VENDPMEGYQQPNRPDADPMSGYQQPNALDRDSMQSDQQASQRAAGPTGQQFVQGTRVYDINGAKVGTVSEHGVQQGSLVIHHGLLRDDIYIPLDMIQGSDADGVTLNMTKQEVETLPVNRSPAGNIPANPDI